jgi:thiamine-phosphate pyrophosphorylase
MASERALRGLYAITPESADTEALAAAVCACLDGGAAMVQYRAKAAAHGLALVQARRLRALCRSRGVPFIVNDSVPLALACEADGVHVGREDAGVREARIALPRGIIGASCYADLDRARRAVADGADYVAVGSVFASATKPAAVRAPLALLGEARAATGLPVVAIGGIDAANAAQAIAAGAAMVAVISALFEAPDVRAAASAFARLFTETFPGEADVRAQPRAV